MKRFVMEMNHGILAGRPSGEKALAMASALRLPLALLAVFFSSSFLPSPASANKPANSPWILGLSPIYSFVVIDQTLEPDGGGGLLLFQYRIDQTFGVQLSGSWSGHELANSEETLGGFLQVITIATDLRYAIDILSFSPAIETGIEILHQRFTNEQSNAQSTEFGVQFGLAFDYWISQKFALGGAFHYHALLTDLVNFPVYFDLGLRVLTRWP